MGCTTTHMEKYDVVMVDLTNGRDYPIYIGNSYSDEEGTLMVVWLSWTVCVNYGVGYLLFRHKLNLLSSNIHTRTVSNITASDILQSHVQGTKVLIVTNDRIDSLYLQKYTNHFPNKQVYTLVLPDGEEHKNMDILNRILDECLEQKLDRRATLVALGGGVIGDMVGFAAAIYQRGVNFIQIPTTVMAMVDSSVGGKTGVNHALGKNMIGAFHQPQCVFIDTDTLETLPDRELVSGVSEMIKYGLIRDGPFFEWLEENIEILLQRDAAAFRYAVVRSCQNKAAVVKADEREAGVRATLNLGHTFGHAIENGSGYGTWFHGEAVAIGTAMAADTSYRMGWIDEPLKERTIQLLERAQLPTRLPKESPMTKEKFLELMSVDKKVADGQLRLILLKGELGNCVFTGDFDESAVHETINDFVTNRPSHL